MPTLPQWGLFPGECTYSLPYPAARHDIFKFLIKKIENAGQLKNIY